MRFLSVRNKTPIPSADTVPGVCQNAASSAPASRERPRSVPPALMDAASQPAGKTSAGGVEGVGSLPPRLSCNYFLAEAWISAGGGWGGKTPERRITKQPNNQGERRRILAHPWFLSPGFVTWLNNAKMSTMQAEQIRLRHQNRGRGRLLRCSRASSPEQHLAALPSHPVLLVLQKPFNFFLIFLFNFFLGVC